MNLKHKIGATMSTHSEKTQRLKANRAKRRAKWNRAEEPTRNDKKNEHMEEHFEAMTFNGFIAGIGES